jgi:biotin operon repressor
METEIIRVFSPPDPTPLTDTWTLIKERGCVTTRDVAAALGITRKAAWGRLKRLERRGLVASRVVDGVVRWCLSDDAPPVAAPRRRPRGSSHKVLKRIETVLGFIGREGCVTTATLRRELGLSETQIHYIMYALMSQGRITQKMVGATALWCCDGDAAQAHVEMLRNAVRRLIKDGVKYVTPAKVLEWISLDREIRRLFSNYISLERYGRGFPAASIAFVSDLLRSLYGEPASYSRRDVYFVARGALPDNVAECCATLRTYIEHKLTSAKGGVVSVKVAHLTKDAKLLPRYSHCLSRLLRPYRLGSGYVIPRAEAQGLLIHLEQRCASLMKMKKGGGVGQRLRRGKTPAVSFFIAKDMLETLDRYAEELGVTRSDIIRRAIEQLLEKLRGGGHDNLRA